MILQVVDGLETFSIYYLQSTIFNHMNYLSSGAGFKGDSRDSQ